MTVGPWPLRMVIVELELGKKAKWYPAHGSSNCHYVVCVAQSTRKLYFFCVSAHMFTTSICGRWDELGETIRFHAGLAESLAAVTEFRLLNGAPPRLLGGRVSGDRRNVCDCV